MEITSRTIHGRYLMRASAEANDLILGVLGKAQAKYNVQLFSFVFLSGHFHLLMRADTVRRMSFFVGYLEGNIAKELGFLHDWKEQFWGRRFNHAPVNDDEPTQIARFMYVLENGCKEGLVDSPLQWPGVTSANAMYDGKTQLFGRWFDRTAQHHAGHARHNETYSTVETVQLSPMPFLATRTAEEQREFIAQAIRTVEQETAERQRDDGRPSIGVAAIFAASPHSNPENFQRSPAPRFHAATAEGRAQLREARRQKQAAYREAADRLKQGDRDVDFPEDCFPPGLPFVESKHPP